MNAISTTPIDRPGLYMTRNGKQVRIDCVDRNTISRWACSGNILKPEFSDRLLRDLWNWQLNGVFRESPGSGLDIVGYIGA